MAALVEFTDAAGVVRYFAKADVADLARDGATITVRLRSGTQFQLPAAVSWEQAKAKLEEWRAG